MDGQARVGAIWVYDEFLYRWDYYVLWQYPLFTGVGVVSRVEINDMIRMITRI